MSGQNGSSSGGSSSNPGQQPPAEHQEHGNVGQDGQEEYDGPQEIFLDDADIAELQAEMEEEGDYPMDEDDDDVEEVEEGPDDGYEDEEEGDDDRMQEAVNDTSLRQIRSHGEGAVFSISPHPISPVLAVSGGEDDNGYLWRLDTGEEIAKLSGHTDSVITTGWSKDGELVATGGMDGRVRVWRRVKPTDPSAWEWGRWEFLTVLEGMDEIHWLDWHPKGAVLVCGTGDGTVWMWQLPSGRNMNVFSGHTSAVTCGQFLPDGKRLVTGSDDGSFIVWDPKTSSSVFKLGNSDGRFRLDGGITCLAPNGSSTACIVGGADGALRIVNLTNGTVAQSLENHGEETSVEGVAWTQGTPGSVGLWVSVGTDKKVKVFEASNGANRWTGEHEDAVTSLTLHPAATHLMTTGSVDRTLKTWDLRTGRLQKTHTGHQDVIHTVSCSVNGAFLTSGSDDGTARVFQV